MRMKDENDMEVLELAYHSCRVKRIIAGPANKGKGCPKCGQKDILEYVDGHRTYACGYSSGIEETPCTNS